VTKKTSSAAGMRPKAAKGSLRMSEDTKGRRDLEHSMSWDEKIGAP